MRNYELTFIVPSDVNDEDMNGVVNQIQGWVEGSQGKITKVDHWGRRRRLYRLKPGPRPHPNHNQLALGLASHSTLTMRPTRKAAGHGQQPYSRAFRRN